MRFKEFLLEEDDNDDEEWGNLEDYVNLHCKEFLDDVGGLENYLTSPLYRGIKRFERDEVNNFMYKNKEVYGLVKSVRTDRKPKDTFKFISNYIDKVLNDKFGWKPRSQGLFTTAIYSNANDYGKVYAIFPIGKYEYVYNDEIDDLTLYLNRLLRRAAKNWGSMAGVARDENEYSAEEKEEIFKYIDNDGVLNKFKNSKLENAIKYGAEIQIKCDKYLAIQYKQKD